MNSTNQKNSNNNNNNHNNNNYLSVENFNLNTENPDTIINNLRRKYKLS